MISTIHKCRHLAILRKGGPKLFSWLSPTVNVVSVELRINPFVANVCMLYPLKAPENQSLVFSHGV